MPRPQIGQFYKGKHHSKVIRILSIHANTDPPTCLAELVIPGGGGKHWPVQWETLSRSYKLLDGPETTPSHLLGLPGMGGILNIPE